MWEKGQRKKSVQGSAAATKQQASSKSGAIKKIRRLSRVPNFFCFFVFVKVLRVRAQGTKRRKEGEESRMRLCPTMDHVGVVKRTLGTSMIKRVGQWFEISMSKK